MYNMQTTNKEQESLSKKLEFLIIFSFFEKFLSFFKN